MDRDGTPRKETPNSCPVVGIGASAGGTEALGQFIRHVPDDSGMAFVIVQHQKPDQKSLLRELLQRMTNRKIMPVKAGMKVVPNSFYVALPNLDTALLQGVFHLFEPAISADRLMPIDFFLNSLAVDKGQLGIGVILSGAGSDGTKGITAIKENAGMVLVQEPSSAKFAGMPRSAIETGLADVVAPVEKLPGKLISNFKWTKTSARPHRKFMDTVGYPFGRLK